MKMRVGAVERPVSKRMAHAGFVCILAAYASTVQAQQLVSFSDSLYPVLQKAGCRTCHNPEGVASPTRLHFPDESASRDKVEAFGKSLVELVDRTDPENSILWKKPTNRIRHSGGERIKRGSPEEAQLKQWIYFLASLSESDVKQALRYHSCPKPLLS